MKKYDEYKQEDKLKMAYETAAKIESENLFSETAPIEESHIYAAGIVGGGKLGNLHKGYMCVADVMNKLSSMVHMFENYSKDKSQAESCAKMMEVADNLFDLARIKIVEAQKETIGNMNKISEKQGYQHPVSPVSSVEEDPSSPPPESNDISSSDDTDSEI